MEPKANAVFIKRESEDEEKLNKLKNMLPLTAHEIYDIILGSPGSHKVLPQLANSEGKYLRKDLVLKAMQEYAQQSMKQERERATEHIEKLSDLLRDLDLMLDLHDQGRPILGKNDLSAKVSACIAELEKLKK